MKITTLLTIATLALTAGCGHVQLVSAVTSTGKAFEYCLQVERVVGTDTLFCGGLSDVQAEQLKEKSLHPDVTTTIVKRVPASEIKAPK